jgi:hypothetical protein
MLGVGYKITIVIIVCFLLLLGLMCFYAQAESFKIDDTKISNNALFFIGDRDTLAINIKHNGLDSVGNQEALKKFDCYYAKLTEADTINFIKVQEILIKNKDVPVDTFFMITGLRNFSGKIVFGIIAEDTSGNRSPINISTYSTNMGNGFLWLSDIKPK